MNVTTKRTIRTLEVIDKPMRNPYQGKRGFFVPPPKGFNKNLVYDERKHITPMEMFNRNRIAELAEEGR